jgi:hypothetical protein
MIQHLQHKPLILALQEEEQTELRVSYHHYGCGPSTIENRKSYFVNATHPIRHRRAIRSESVRPSGAAR